MLNIKAPKRRAKFWWHLTWAYTKRYKLWLVSTALLLLFLLFTGYKLFPNLSRGNTISIGYIGSYSIENIPTKVLSLATDSLITEDQNGKPIPQLSSHWTVEDEGKTYVVFLKDNLKWHDLTDVVAKDILIAINGVQITALNNKAIEFKLPNPIPSFPLLLDKPVFKAKSFYGTGKYKIVGIDKLENTVKKIRLFPKNKNLPKVEIKFYSNQEQAINALKIGDIKRISVSSAQELQSWPNLNVEKTVDRNEIVTIFYNTQDQHLASKELRQALSFAINDSDFDGIVANGPISPANWAYSAPQRYEYNMGKAKELLAKSQDTSPQITLSTTSDLQEIAQKIKSDWENIGVKVSIKVEGSVPKDFQALLIVNQLKPDPDQYALWHSTQTQTNISRFKDPRIDKLLEDGRNTQEEDKRKEIYADFQKVIMEHVPASFLYYPYKYKVTYKNVEKLFIKLPNNQL